MNEWAQKRFWKEATVEQSGESFQILLDGRVVKTPLKSVLMVPAKELADEIAGEWGAQGETIDPLSMPATRYANAAIDKVAHQHNEVAQMLAAYGETDLLCYRAAQPESLVARQREAWDPLLQWAADVLDAPLVTGEGVMFVEQDKTAVANLSKHVSDMSVFALAAFHDLVSLSGSLVLALAAAKKLKTPQNLWDLSRIDEDWQIEQWGRDEEADALAAKKQESFENAYRFYHWV